MGQGWHQATITVFLLCNLFERCILMNMGSKCHKMNSVLASVGRRELHFMLMYNRLYCFIAPPSQTRTIILPGVTQFNHFPLGILVNSNTTSSWKHFFTYTLPSILTLRPLPGPMGRSLVECLITRHGRAGFLSPYLQSVIPEGWNCPF